MDLKLKNNSQITLNNFNRVEYIQNTGFPDINTGVVHSGTQPTVECEIEVISNVDKQSIIYCAFEQAIMHYGLACNPSNITSFHVRRIINSRNYYNNNVTFSERVKIVHNKNGMTINGVPVSINTDNSGGYNFSGTLKILSQPNSNYGNVIVKIYSFKVYNISDVLIRDYIPVLSYESGHIGEACLYDKVNNTFYYSASTGSFIASGDCLYKKITTAFIKDCPSITLTSTINILRAASNLTNVRCDIGSVSGTLAELQHYATLHGFNNHEEPDNTIAPVINGAFTITDWYTNEELQALQGTIVGLTIVVDSSKNIDSALINEDFAIQTLDSTKPNYNPAAAIILKQHNIGTVRDNSIISGGGRYFVLKSDAATITTSDIEDVFSNTATVIDTEAIVSNDNTATYDFVTFNEFRYFTSVTSLDNAIIGGCTKLEEVTVPEGVMPNVYWRYAFRDCTNLQTITFTNAVPDGAVASYIYMNCSSLNKLVFPSLNLLLKQVYIGGSRQEYGNTPFVTSGSGRYFINDEELVDLVIPDSVTSITNACFYNVKNLKTISFNNLQTIGDYAFSGCTSLPEILDIRNVNISNYTFNECTSLKEVYVHDAPTRSFQNCTSLKNLIIYGNSSPTVALGGGDGTGTIEFFQSLSENPLGFNCGNWRHILVHGNVNNTAGYGFFSMANGVTETVRLMGNFTGSGYLTYFVYSNNLKFIEVNGTFSRPFVVNTIYVYNGYIEHLGNSVLAGTAVNAQIDSSRCAKVYVGDGSSRANDEATLALYLADADWSAYSSKLATWYDYNGEYKWYYVTDNLTNCTNTNPDEWPHITRGKSYQTTIEPFEGMTLNSVTVKMLDTDITSNTYDTMVDITSDVYDPTIGEINIPSVTGNVIITANAS